MPDPDRMRHCSFLYLYHVRIIFYVHCASNQANRRYLGSLLNPGTLTAPERFRLVLLRSRPDTVHGFPSRETRISTSLTKGSSASCRPPRNITPAIADCRYKAPLPPRLHESIFYPVFVKMSMDEAQDFRVRRSYQIGWD